MSTALGMYPVPRFGRPAVRAGPIASPDETQLAHLRAPRPLGGRMFLLSIHCSGLSYVMSLSDRLHWLHEVWPPDRKQK